MRLRVDFHKWAKACAGAAAACACVYGVLVTVGSMGHRAYSDRSPSAIVLFAIMWMALAAGVIIRLLSASSVSRVRALGATQNNAVTRAPVRRHSPWRAWPFWCGLLVVLGVYHGLFLPGAITWGDWGYFVNSGAVRALFPVASAWTYSNLGQANLVGVPQFPIFAVEGLLAHLGMSYALIERLVWYWPAVMLAYVGMYRLMWELRGSPWTSALAGMFFATNAYALAVISGGQLTVGCGYALLPLVALSLVRYARTPDMWRSMAVGVVLGIQAWCDIREAFMTALVAALCVTVCALIRTTRPAVRRILSTRGLVGIGVFAALQLPWVLAAAEGGGAGLPRSYTTPSALSSLSFMSLGDGLTIFHPFWPRMHFVTIFPVPLWWLVVPLAAAWAISKPTWSIRAALGVAIYLVFAALVEGAQPPFGAINAWLFAHIPGMSVFRDPSPYFGPAALGAATFLGRTATAWHRPTQLRVSTAWAWAAPLAVCALVLVSGFPALSGSLKHDLAPSNVPQGYITLTSYLRSKPPGNVLWVPSIARFAPTTVQHPNVSAWDMGYGSGALAAWSKFGAPLSWLDDTGNTPRWFRQYNVAFVVVRLSSSSYHTYSLQYPATADRIEGLLSGYPRKVIGNLAVYAVGQGSAPVRIVGPSKVLEAARAFKNMLYKGFATQVTIPSGAAGVSPSPFPDLAEPIGTNGTSAFATSGSIGKLGLALPENPVTVLEVEFSSGLLLARTVSPIRGISINGSVVAAPPRSTIHWTTVGPLSAGRAARGVVLEVRGAKRFISGQSLRGGKAVLVGAYHARLGEDLQITAYTLGPNLVPNATFAQGLRGWGPVGNVNNYNHLKTLQAANISATVGGACGSNALLLHAGKDAAGIAASPLALSDGPVVVGAEMLTLQGAEGQLDAFGIGGRGTSIPVTGLAGAWSLREALLSEPPKSLELIVYAGESSASTVCMKYPFERALLVQATASIPVHLELKVLQPEHFRESQGGIASVQYRWLSGLARLLTPVDSTFFDGRDGWSQVGNVNNYAHLSNTSAGISGRVVSEGGLHFLRLTAATGAAGVSRAVSLWYGASTVNIMLRYRTSPSASLSISVFGQGQQGPDSVQTLPPSTALWRTTTLTVHPRSLGSTTATNIVVSIALAPAKAGTPGFADVRQVTISESLPVPALLGDTPRALSSRLRQGMKLISWSGPRADTFTVHASPSASGALLVFDQAFDPRWIASDPAGQPLKHLIVDGWANGYVIPPASEPMVVTLSFEPEQWIVRGMIMVALALASAGVLGLLRVRGKRPN